MLYLLYKIDETEFHEDKLIGIYMCSKLANDVCKKLNNLYHQKYQVYYKVKEQELLSDDKFYQSFKPDDLLMEEYHIVYKISRKNGTKQVEELIPSSVELFRYLYPDDDEMYHEFETKKLTGKYVKNFYKK